MPRIKRRILEAATPPQLGMFGTGTQGELPTPARAKAISFVAPDPREIFLGARRLDAYLKQAGQVEAFQLRTLLSGLDYSEFLTRYRGVGRPPYAPWLMLGIVLYGVMKGVSTLSKLEDLARVDLGCMWVSGGIMPDHSVIGDFLVLHRETLTDSFFEELTRGVLKVVGGDTQNVAGDGTMLRAWASRASTLKAEAVAERAERARAEATAHPEDPVIAEKAAQAEANAKLAAERKEGRRAKGRDHGGPVLNPNEPEAVVQQMKDGVVAPGYKASVLANSDRLILGKQVEQTSEIKAVEPMLDQAERIGDKPVIQGLFDAGYFADAMFEKSVERNIDLLCSEGQTQSDDEWEKKSDKQYPKSRFEYDANTDSYRCPAGQKLEIVEQCKGNETYRGYRKYGTAACGGCPLRGHCTKAVEGRRITRFATDELREAQRQVMRHPKARQRYKSRKAWVEPVFSSLKEQQGLRRFKRRGLFGAGLEFSLHAMAHNVRRMVALAQRVPGARERLLALGGALIVCLLALLSRLWSNRSTSPHHSDYPGWVHRRPSYLDGFRLCMFDHAGID